MADLGFRTAAACCFLHAEYNGFPVSGTVFPEIKHFLFIRFGILKLIHLTAVLFNFLQSIHVFQGCAYCSGISICSVKTEERPNILFKMVAIHNNPGSGQPVIKADNPFASVGMQIDLPDAAHVIPLV